MLYVKEANDKDIEKEWLFVKEMPEDENGLTNECYDIKREGVQNWIKLLFGEK